MLTDFFLIIGKEPIWQDKQERRLSVMTMFITRLLSAYPAFIKNMKKFIYIPEIYSSYENHPQFSESNQWE